LEVLRQAAEEARYLLDRGYPKDSAIRFISNHHGLLEVQRYVLARVVLSSAPARARKAKAIPVQALSGKDVIVDGYNVLITVESLLAGCPVYLCDDGFLRDTRGISKRYRTSRFTDIALSLVFDLLAFTAPARIEFLLDQQMSRSGELAARIRYLMAGRNLPGTACTARDTDHRLKTDRGIVASADGNVIDAASVVVDIPAEIARMRGISPLHI
jgi:hypothetical protein